MPNPSFEEALSCPDSPGDIVKAVGWSSYSLSPDYLNRCSNSGAGIPSNYFGYQEAFIGDAYVGLLTYDGLTPNSPFREYIGIELSQTLTIGVKYFVSCFISKGDLFPLDGASNNFGFRFSTKSYDYLNNPFTADNFSQVHCDSIITDTMGWVKITGSFIADSSFQYLILGNFYDNLHTNTFQVYQRQAYYYIDAVCVSTDSLFDLNWTGIIKSSTITNQFIIFPNPTNDIINLKGLKNNFNYSLFNSIGQIIKEGIVNEADSKIDVSSFPKGLYRLELKQVYYIEYLLIIIN